MAELAEQLEVDATKITGWRRQLPEGAAGVFGSERDAAVAARTIGVMTLHDTIGDLISPACARWTRVIWRFRLPAAGCFATLLRPEGMRIGRLAISMDGRGARHENGRGERL